MDKAGILEDVTFGSGSLIIVHIDFMVFFYIKTSFIEQKKLKFSVLNVVQMHQNFSLNKMT